VLIAYWTDRRTDNLGSHSRHCNPHLHAADAMSAIVPAAFGSVPRSIASQEVSRNPLAQSNFTDPLISESDTGPAHSNPHYKILFNINQPARFRSSKMNFSQKVPYEYSACISCFPAVMFNNARSGTMYVMDSFTGVEDGT
jgi:hypothetical protein